LADTAIFAWASAQAGDLSIAREKEKPKKLRTSKKGARNNWPLLNFCLPIIGRKTTDMLSREAGRDPEITSRAAGELRSLKKRA